ncbi:hypothetical protein F4703DRAFT_1737278, partial [Phycomyces blakesleeanus]
KDSTWPPRFYKILLTLKGPQDKSPIDMALTDSRRLGRIRLVGGDPLKSEPISKLGFDPILNLPNEDTFTALVQKRAMPIKALLLDHGVGNWVADEILYHSHIHPAQYANTLSTAQCHTLHQNMEYVCRTAVEADADSSLFPDNWIMNYRWKKGKGKGNGVLPNGQVMAFETVGGRTSCFVPEVQVLPESQKTKSEVKTKVKKRPIKEENDQITECIKKDGMSRAERYIKRAKTKANSLSNQRRLAAVPARKERVVILGCSSGIGRETALTYAARGASLVLFARRMAMLESLEQECKDRGATKVLVVQGDVGSQVDLEKIKTRSREELGGLDTAIYCAGMISVRPFFEACNIEFQKSSDQKSHYTAIETKSTSSYEALKKITDINYFAAVEATRVLLPLMIETSDMPNWIVISSMAGKVGAPTRAMYAGSKHAVHGFFDSLRVEVEKYGVHVGLVCPGTVDTELRASAVDRGTGEIAGSTKGKLSPQSVASRIVAASDRREREVYIPVMFGYAAVWAKLVASELVDWAAKRKYSSA